VGLGDLARYISFGASPRASISMILAARALAFVRGRDYALPPDVGDLALDVLRHRIVLSYEAMSAEITADQVLRRAMAACPCPTSRHGCATAHAPEQLLRRLRVVVRRPTGSCRAVPHALYGSGMTSPTCALHPRGRRPPHR
jgi:hypothetical protein